jgi:hypothetical protein
MDDTANLSQSNAYFVRPVLNRREQVAGTPFTLKANAPAQQYLSIPLHTPSGYSPNDASIGDFDGDSKDEIVYGACCVDNRKGLYTTRLEHGDALHLSVLYLHA